MKLRDAIITDNGWQIAEDSFKQEGIINSGSNFMVGNGYLGLRSTFENWGKEYFPACTVTDTWDRSAPEKMSELCNVPNPIFAQIFIDDEEVSLFTDEIISYNHSLDLYYGINRREFSVKLHSGKVATVVTEKFASYDIMQLVPSKISIFINKDARLTLQIGLDSDVWSLNGNHYSSVQAASSDDVLAYTCVTKEDSIEIAVSTSVSNISQYADVSEITEVGGKLLRSYVINAEADKEITLERNSFIYHSKESDSPYDKAVASAKEYTGRTYEELLDAHKPHWDEIWSKSDVDIDGDLEDNLLMKFNLYMAIIATPVHDYLPIGARGLSCQVYQGAAFWDQEIFNLPMYIYSNPEMARKILMYRHKTLDGARKKAKNLGYYGAFYAWTSGKTGEELFPDYFFTDVLTGRKMHNHFNCWQIHISPDISYAIWSYYEVTGDWEFIRDYGAEIMFEIAQFIVSRVYFKKDKDRYEFVRLLGPDEYHENVDNNVYTNYISKYVLEKTLVIYRKLKESDSASFQKLTKDISLPESAEEDWQDIVNKIYLPQPDKDTLLIEQFDGYFKREDITPEELKKRLIDPGEYWGWPNGIAVETQVLKQADLLQLFAVVELFPNEVVSANYDYYEPRTEHGSSLSPSVHSIVAAKSGNMSEAYRYFKEASSIDIFAKMRKVNSGGSFLGGIHTAAAGGVWMMAVQGFAGFIINDEGIHITPRLPENWKSVSFAVLFRGIQLQVVVQKSEVTITSSEQNADLVINGNDYSIKKGETLSLNV